MPTARFAQPIGALILYPMFAVVGPLRPDRLAAAGAAVVTRCCRSPTRCRCSRDLAGDAWSAHVGDVAALTVVFVVCTALSARVFRWE